MAKKGAAKTQEDPGTGGQALQSRDCLFRATVQYTSAGWGKAAAKLGCRISAKRCTAKIRDEYLANATLRVVISADPECDAAPLPGMEGTYPHIEVDVKVNQYSANAGEVSFSMSLAREDVPAQFLKDIAHSAGALFILSVKHDENSVETDEDEE